VSCVLGEVRWRACVLGHLQDSQRVGCSVPRAGLGAPLRLALRAWCAQLLRLCHFSYDVELRA
jgi:hypothetical protein